MKAMISAQYKRVKQAEISAKTDDEIVVMLTEDLAGADDSRVDFIYSFVPSGLSKSTYEDNLKKLAKKMLNLKRV